MKSIRSGKKTVLWIMMAAIVVGMMVGSCLLLNPKEKIEDAQETDISKDSPEEIQEELERVVCKVGLEQALIWTEGVDLEEDTDALIWMASSNTGRFEIYGIVSAKYGTYGLLLNDWTGGCQNWNFELVPWYYAEELSQQPVLEPYENSTYLFQYLEQYEDGVFQWQESILDCGYDTGHMELISQEEYKNRKEDQQELNADIPTEEILMTDISKVSSIVLLNGNTGEQREITIEDYDTFGELLNLYSQLDFTSDHEKNVRVGYQYSMILKDANGEKLQRVTPYKDGLGVDDRFYLYDDTSTEAAAALRCMESIERIFYPDRSYKGNRAETEQPVNIMENVSITLENADSQKGNLKITNDGKKDMMTGAWYEIQKLENGLWQQIEAKNHLGWEESAYVISKGEELVQEVDWEGLYGKLPEGHYRIIKQGFSDLTDSHEEYFLAAEFDISF